MRITESIKFASIKMNARRNSEEYFKAHEKVISGRKINRPSDDPAGAYEISRLKNLKSSIEQYERNINVATSRLQTVDSLLERIGARLIRAKELAVRESTETENTENRVTAATEISGIIDDILAIANTKLEGKYIFAGFRTTTQPFDASYNYNGDSGSIEVFLDETMKVATNLPGDVLFTGAGGGVDIFAELDNLKTALETDDTIGIAAAIDGMESAMDQILEGRAKVGTWLNSVELKGEDLANFKLSISSTMSIIEDVDIAEAITTLQQMQNSYMATLNSSAKLVQGSLMDFLR